MPESSNPKDYDAKNKEVKNIYRRDKRAFADQVAKEAEEAINKRDMGALHKITGLCATACFQRPGDQSEHITTKEVADAIQSLKNGKANGIDLPTSVVDLCSFFNELWEREEIP